MNTTTTGRRLWVIEPVLLFGRRMRQLRANRSSPPTENQLTHLALSRAGEPQHLRSSQGLVEKFVLARLDLSPHSHRVELFGCTRLGEYFVALFPHVVVDVLAEDCHFCIENFVRYVRRLDLCNQLLRGLMLDLPSASRSASLIAARKAG